MRLSWKSAGFYTWGLFGITLFVLTNDEEFDFLTQWLINLPFYFWLMVLSIKVFPNKRANSNVEAEQKIRGESE